MRRAGVGLVLLTALALGVGLGARPARAHADLESAVPVPNSIATTVVSEIVLTFSERVVLFGDGVTVSNGTEVVRTTPAVSGTTITARLVTPIGAGSYDVTWNIESADGHRLTQSYPFSVAAGVVAPVTAPGTLPETTTTTTGGDTTTVPTTAAPDPTTTTTTPQSGESITERVPNWALYAIPAAVIVGLAALIGALVRRARRPR